MANSVGHLAESIFSELLALRPQAMNRIYQATLSDDPTAFEFLSEDAHSSNKQKVDPQPREEDTSATK